MYLELYPDGDVIEYCGFVFALTDIDKSGYIDFKEFLQMINLASTSSPEEKLRWTFRLADTNGDGHIDFKEMMGIVNVSNQQFTLFNQNE